MRASRDEKHDIIYDQEQEISQLKNQVAELNAQQRKLQREIDRIPPEILDELRSFLYNSNIRNSEKEG